MIKLWSWKKSDYPTLFIYSYEKIKQKTNSKIKGKIKTFLEKASKYHEQVYGLRKKARRQNE